MGGLYLESRLEFLRASQNSDGGWSYFPGKGSWLEPTTYAMLALHGTGSDRGTGSGVEAGTILAASGRQLSAQRRGKGRHLGNGARSDLGERSGCEMRMRSVRSSVDWLLRVVGAEHNLWTRTGAFLHLIKARLDVSHEGWPWREGNASWIEPTAHTLVALKKVAGQYRAGEVEHRIQDGEALILSRRCTDGGWNYGTPNMLYVDLPSYPETTAPGVDRAGRRRGSGGEPGAEPGAAVSRGDQIVVGQSVASDRAARPWPGRRGAGGNGGRLARRDAGGTRSPGTSGRKLQIVLWSSARRGRTRMTRRKFAVLSGAAVVGAYGSVRLQKLREAAEAVGWAGGKIGRGDYPSAVVF